MRFDASMESLINTGRSESFVDLNETDLALSRSVLNQGRDMFMSYQGKMNNRSIIIDKNRSVQLYFSNVKKSSCKFHAENVVPTKPDVKIAMALASWHITINYANFQMLGNFEFLYLNHFHFHFH